jgi:hypothetical protein
VGCDFPEHHRGSGVDLWLLLALAVAAAVFAGLWLSWEALGRPVAVSTVVAGLVLAGVLVGTVRAVVGSVRSTPRRKTSGAVETPMPVGPRKAGVTGPESPAADPVDELAARRARRVA